MKKNYKFALFLLISLGIILVVLLFVHLIQGGTMAVLVPKGTIALKERNLMITAVLLMLIVVIPVFFLTGFIAWKYRASNTKAKYTPEWDHNTKLETLWWGLPCAIILVISILAWNGSHALDPYKVLASTNKPITIQVVALDWKWLFIYPEQDIATVNFVQFPENTPVDFVITADAPMNSFWIPQLGGQIYAMPGMTTQLHLMADGAGSYRGSSANISGDGFAGMKFTAQSSSQDDFNEWVRTVKESPNRLSGAEYNNLAKPSSNSPTAFYSSAQDGLYNDVMMKFMMPGMEIQ